MEAIQAGSGTEKRLRYWNPDIIVVELKIRKENRPGRPSDCGILFED
jgi:hypothetical protein